MRLFRARRGFRAVCDSVEIGPDTKFVEWTRIHEGQLFAVSSPDDLPCPSIGLTKEFYDEVLPRGLLRVGIDKYMRLEEIE